MRSKCITCTSRLKFVTGNVFSNSGFLHDTKILTVRCSFSPFVRFVTVHAQFQPYFYVRFEISRHTIRFFLTTYWASPIRRATPSSATFVTTISAVFLLPVVNLSQEMHSVTSILYNGALAAQRSFLIVRWVFTAHVHCVSKKNFPPLNSL